MHRLTLVNRFAYPDDSPTSRLMQDLAASLAKTRPDIEIRILCCNRLYGASEQTLPARQTIEGIHFTRLWAPSSAHRGLLMRALGYFAFYFQGLLRLVLDLRRGELVICMSDPPMFNVLATLAAQLRGTRIVHWVQDLYPDVVQSAGLMRSAPLMSLLRTLRRAAYRASTRLVVIGKGMHDRLLNDGSGCPIDIIPNWADGSRIQPLPRESLPLAAQWLPAGSRFVVGYFGNLGFAHNFQSSLNAAVLLMGRPDVQFLWVGDGSRRMAFQQAVQALALDNVHWQGQQPFDRMPEILGLADLHLVMLDPQFDEVLVPSKTYSALAAGRALLFIGSLESELARLVREHDVGLAVALDDSAGIAAAIRTLADDPERCQGMGQRARRLFDQQFERTRVMGRWQALMETLLPR